MGTERSCGPAGVTLASRSLEDGTLFRGLSSRPGISGFHLFPGGFCLKADYLHLTPTEYFQRLNDEAEFKTLVEQVRVLNRDGRFYTDVDDYIADRNEFFGSIWDYVKFAEESDKELEESKRVGRKGRVTTLRSRLDSQFQGKKMDAAVKYFYRWVRKAYKREYGDETDVPAFIFRGRSDAMDEALKGIKFEDASYGGFNPRPIKGIAKAGKKEYRGYRLGTISDHASGMAIDIESDDNPQISVAAWAFIEKLVGKSSTVQWREAQWLSNPGVLWKYVKDLSDGFVAEVAKREKLLLEEEKKQQEEARKKAAAADKTAAPKTPLPTVPVPAPDPSRFKRKILGDHYDALNKYTDGFFTLKQDLVEALREHGLNWGAIFGKSAPIDLMHFELPKTPLPHWPPAAKK
jgi:hypothetical protein